MASELEWRLWMRKALKSFNQRARRQMRRIREEQARLAAGRGDEQAVALSEAACRRAL